MQASSKYNLVKELNVLETASFAKSLETVANLRFVDHICTFTEISQNVLTKNAPPFYYSYQCSSSLISSFLSIFIYIYSFLSTVVPILKLKMMLLTTNGYLEYIQKRIPFKLGDLLGSYIFSLSEDSIHESFRVTDVDVNRIAENNDDTDDDRMTSYWWNKSIRFKGSTVISTICTHITVMLTFGLSFPPLGLMILGYIFIDIIVWRLAIGRYMKIISSTNDNKTYDINLKILENSCIEGYQCLYRSGWIIQIIIGFYWSFMIFDVIGSENSSLLSGIKASVLLFIFYTSIFITSDKLLGDEKYSSYSIVRILRHTAFHIHSFIWTKVLKLGSMRSINYEEIISSEEKVSDKIFSIQSEIFSPISNSNM